MKKQTIFLTVILSLTSFSLNLSADQAEHGVGEIDTSQTRSIADLKLSDQAVNFISSYFWTPSNIVQEKYGKKMPQAMEKALKGDESEISPMISKLMGTLNKTQTQRMAIDALAIRKAEFEKAASKETKEDERYVGMLDRFIYASIKVVPDMPDVDEDTKKELKKIADDDKAKAFNKAFDGDLAAIKVQNDKTLEKLKQAGEGNKEALDWVKKNLDQKGLLKWAEGQKKNGNSEAAEKVVNAVALKVGDQKVLDMTNGKDTERLFLGNDKASLGKALDGLFKNGSAKGFGTSMVSYEPHPGTPNKQWFINDKGEFTVGAPTGFVPPDQKVLESPKPTTPTTGGGGAKPSTPSQGNPGSGNNANFNKFAAIVKTGNCTSCHTTAGITGTSFSNMQLQFNNKPGKLSGFLSKIEDGGPMGTLFSDAQRAELKRLAASGN